MLSYIAHHMFGTRLARAAWFSLVASCAIATAAKAAAPTFAISQAGSSIKFFVKASMSVSGTFDNWNATLTFASTDASTGVLDIQIQAASVNTGSGLKNSKL